LGGLVGVGMTPLSGAVAGGGMLAGVGVGGAVGCWGDYTVTTEDCVLVLGLESIGSLHRTGARAASATSAKIAKDYGNLKASQVAGFHECMTQ
jgi:hypothetical protein